MVRITLPESAWRRLRLAAADQDISLTRLVGAILEAEAAGIAIKALDEDAPKARNRGRA